MFFPIISILYNKICFRKYSQAGWWGHSSKLPAEALERVLWLHSFYQEIRIIMKTGSKPKGTLNEVMTIADPEVNSASSEGKAQRQTWLEI